MNPTQVVTETNIGEIFEINIRPLLNQSMYWEEFQNEDDYTKILEKTTMVQSLQFDEISEKDSYYDEDGIAIMFNPENSNCKNGVLIKFNDEICIADNGKTILVIRKKDPFNTLIKILIFRDAA